MPSDSEHGDQGRRDRGAPAPHDEAAALDAQLAAAEAAGPTEKALSVKVSTDVLDRATNAFYGSQRHARWKDFVEEALDRYAEALEREQNQGKPFPPKPGEQLTRGRRVGVSPRRVD